MKEEHLSGGNSGSQVVRIGQRVHRKARRNAPSLHAFLTHLRDSGIGEVPRVFGVDHSGREVLEFIEGQVGHDPKDWQATSLLVDGAELLLKIHDASCKFAPEEKSEWAPIFPHTLDTK